MSSVKEPELTLTRPVSIAYTFLGFVLNALNIGYRLIDTAAVYNNEESVGKAIKKNNVRREEIFVTTKFVPANVGYEKTKQACEASLKKMGLNYIDLFLIHLPQGDVNSSWKSMEELYKEGKVRAIGVSNFNMNQISDLVKHHNASGVQPLSKVFRGGVVLPIL